MELLTFEHISACNICNCTAFRGCLLPERVTEAFSSVYVETYEIFHGECSARSF